MCLPRRYLCKSFVGLLKLYVVQCVKNRLDSERIVELGFIYQMALSGTDRQER